MEHPPKQGLKQEAILLENFKFWSFNGTSTKTRIETNVINRLQSRLTRVLMEHPPKQGLKHQPKS